MSVVLREISVTPSGKALGADVSGVDLSAPPAGETMSQVMQAWHEHLVIRFRDQSLTDEQFVAFGKRFGQLDLPNASAAGSPRRPDIPQMSVISNIVVNGKQIGALGNYEALWHTDMSYIDVPPNASLLYAIEIPPEGGDTWFANMYAAYDALPAALMKRAETLSCKHDASYNSAGELRKGLPASPDPRTSPGAVHPVVRTHPETGRKALFLGRRLNAYIPGLGLEESEALLDELWAHACQPSFTWVQQWRVGDLIIWDNRCTMHYRESLDSSTRRLLNRLQIKGTKPF